MEFLIDHLSKENFTCQISPIVIFFLYKRSFVKYIKSFIILPFCRAFSFTAPFPRKIYPFPILPLAIYAYSTHRIFHKCVKHFCYFYICSWFVVRAFTLSSACQTYTLQIRIELYMLHILVYMRHNVSCLSFLLCVCWRKPPFYVSI